MTTELIIEQKPSKNIRFSVVELPAASCASVVQMIGQPMDFSPLEEGHLLLIPAGEKPYKVISKFKVWAFQNLPLGAIYAIEKLGTRHGIRWYSSLEDIDRLAPGCMTEWRDYALTRDFNKLLKKAAKLGWREAALADFEKRCIAHRIKSRAQVAAAARKKTAEEKAARLKASKLKHAKPKAESKKKADPKPKPKSAPKVKPAKPNLAGNGVFISHEPPRYYEPPRTVLNGWWPVAV